MRPVIGITPSTSTDKILNARFRRYVLAENYANAVQEAGGIPLILPLHAEAVDALLDRIDGVLLTGGGDVDPGRYHESDVHPTTYGVDAQRDQFEIDLVHSAIARDMPVFCICRGIQIANVALGGTLIQDIPTEIGSDILHRQHRAGYAPEDASHPVSMDTDSRLGRIVGDNRLATNSYHHQAIRQLAPGLIAVATTDDGIIEGIERQDSTWFLGVQWHPEMMYHAHETHARLFQAFVTHVAGTIEMARS